MEIYLIVGVKIKELFNQNNRWKHIAGGVLIGLGLNSDNTGTWVASALELRDKLCKLSFAATGGCIGWAVAEFRPTFPLIIVAVIFIMYDAWTAFQLDKRVKKKYPDRTKRKKVYFTSFAFGKVIKVTIPKRLWLIFLSYLCEHWVFIHITIPLSYIATGAICFEQLWSIFENESSCRNEEDSRFWKLLQKIMVDKTERHFEVNLQDIKQEEDKK